MNSDRPAKDNVAHLFWITKSVVLQSNPSVLCPISDAPHIIFREMDSRAERRTRWKPITLAIWDVALS